MLSVIKNNLITNPKGANIFYEELVILKVVLNETKQIENILVYFISGQVVSLNKFIKTGFLTNYFLELFLEFNGREVLIKGHKSDFEEEPLQYIV